MTFCERSMIRFSMLVFVVVVVLEEGAIGDFSVLLFNMEGDSVMLASFVVAWLRVDSTLEGVVVVVCFRDSLEGGSCMFVVLYLLTGGDGS